MLPMLNVGCFAMQAGCEHWQRWGERLGEVIRRGAFGYFSEQTALNVTVYTQKAWPCFLPARFNWLCVHAAPQFDEERGLFVEPELPHDEIGIVHARRTGPSWFDRVPLVGFEQLDTSRLEAKVYQAAMLFLLSALPPLTFIHFWQVAADAEVLTTATSPVKVPGGIWDCSGLTSLNHPATICTNVQTGPPLSVGVSCGKAPGAGGDCECCGCLVNWLRLLGGCPCEAAKTTAEKK